MKVPPPLIESLRRKKSFLIASHARPDGDAIGSQLALLAMLEKAGKNVVIQSPYPVPDNMLFLPGSDRIDPYGPLPFPPEAAILVDSPTPARVGKVKEHLDRIPFIINIDHHISNSGYGDISWVEAESSSVGEMLFHLFRAAGVELSRSLALCIYVAVLTDMGKFQYMVTPESGERIFSLAAQLTATGLIPYEIYKQVYNLYSTAPLMLLGEALGTLKFVENEQIAYMEIDREMLKRYGDGFDITENLIAYPRDIVTTRVALLFTEQDFGIKVSFRSKEPELIDVNRIAARFGGGGHPAAAGAELPGPLCRARKEVVAAVADYLRGLDKAGRGRREDGKR